MSFDCFFFCFWEHASERKQCMAQNNFRRNDSFNFKLKKPRFPFNLQRSQNFRFEFQAASSGEWNSISEILKREQSREEFSLGIPKFSSIFSGNSTVREFKQGVWTHLNQSSHQALRAKIQNGVYVACKILLKRCLRLKIFAQFYQHVFLQDSLL